MEKAVAGLSQAARHTHLRANGALGDQTLASSATCSCVRQNAVRWGAGCAVAALEDRSAVACWRHYSVDSSTEWLGYVVLPA